ncbi:MAG: KpsF/GutQ family sugar-phosphate isomerase [Candidatus Aminicenantes bacterium]|nr:KpsF/GutQ family sugar-phosphate isomerase [Candidatus Aminicenantes bacterium]
MTKKNIIQTGKEVLEIEAKAVKNLSQRLDEKFAHAVDLLFRTKARVIVTGMGKSGLVGRKITSTLASCGTPALFIHPAEAGHGDLGMIHKDDILIAISYSGETKEIIQLLDFIKRIGIKLIGITGNTRSTLAKYSDVVLDARVEKEAGPNPYIPTASSTASLAIGDALAIALMKKKGFTEEDFAQYHPKGEIARKLIKVKSLMHKGNDIPVVIQTTFMSDVIDMISEKKLGMTCVINEKKKLTGVITDGDLRRMLKKHGREFLKKTALECMTPSPVTISKEELATKALHLMEENRITSLVIQDAEGMVEGVIHLHDLWRTEMF